MTSPRRVVSDSPVLCHYDMFLKVGEIILGLTFLCARWFMYQTNCYAFFTPRILFGEYFHYFASQNLRATNIQTETWTLCKITTNWQHHRAMAQVKLSFLSPFFLPFSLQPQPTSNSTAKASWHLRCASPRISNARPHIALIESASFAVTSRRTNIHDVSWCWCPQTSPHLFFFISHYPHFIHNNCPKSSSSSAHSKVWVFQFAWHLRLRRSMTPQPLPWLKFDVPGSPRDMLGGFMVDRWRCVCAFLCVPFRGGVKKSP